MNIFIIQKASFSLFQTNLAGKPFSEHLNDILINLKEEFSDIEYSIVKPRFSQSVSLDNVLLVDAEVWFSHKAFKNILTAIKINKKSLKFVENNYSSNNEVQAVYVSSNIIDYGSIVDLESISNELRDFAHINTFEMDNMLPPVRIKDMLDITLLEKQIFFSRACEAIRNGVRIRDPHTIAIRGELTYGSDVEIDINVIIENKVNLGDRVKIGAHSILSNTIIGNDSQIKPFSIIEDANIGSNTFVGPYGRIRPGSIIGDFVQIGNFVEIKNSHIDCGGRINHLAFIGDALLKKDVTIGAGVITCNHNGITTTKTIIEKGAYIGSGTQLIAPLQIGANATIGAGSTISQNVPAGKLTLARSRQTTIDGWIRYDKSKQSE